jgi:hypothetical protein
MAGMEFGFVLRDKIRKTASKDTVINVNGKDENIIEGFCQEHSWVCSANTESQVSKCAAEGFIPFSLCLFESIKQFMKSLNLLPLSFISGWLMHVKLFIVIEFAIEVGTIEVK